MTTLAFSARCRIAKVFSRLEAGLRRLMLRFAATNAQARLHKARLEAELCRNPYRLRIKSNDDRPIVG
jgi:hypothetical protein